MKKEKTELKTLQDFEELTYLYNDKEGKALNLYNKLRAEAVKWAKKFELEPIQYPALKWIKHFFNLTSGDLK